MTRWARGACANRKKPLDATKWTEMKSDLDANGLNTNAATQKKRTTEHFIPQKFKHKVGSRQEVQVRSDVSSELEKLGKESRLAGNLSESVVLEEFVHKDARREARRLKRQQEKRQARVCIVCRSSNRVTNSYAVLAACVD